MLVIGGLVKLIVIGGITICLLMSVWKVLAIVFEGLVRVLYSVFFKKQQKGLEQERNKSIQTLRDMGIDV